MTSPRCRIRALAGISATLLRIVFGTELLAPSGNFMAPVCLGQGRYCVYLLDLNSHGRCEMRARRTRWDCLQCRKTGKLIPLILSNGDAAGLNDEL